MREFFFITLPNYISLGLPIAWEEIGVIATTLAVIVSLLANRGARKQLVKALEMQEQSKNVALLDERLQIVDQIRQDIIPSDTAIKILFDEKIFACYTSLRDARNEHNLAQDDEDSYFRKTMQQDEIGQFVNPVKEKIEEYEYYLERPDCPQTIFEQYQKYCDDNELWWSDTGLSDDRRTYNHAEIRNRMITAHQDFQNHKQRIIDLMEEFISSSIAPVNN